MSDEIKNEVLDENEIGEPPYCIIQLNEENRCISMDCSYRETDKTIKILHEDLPLPYIDFSYKLYDFKYDGGRFIDVSEKSDEKEKQEELLNDMMLQSQRARFLLDLPDEKAVKIPLCYQSWAIGIDYIKGDRVECDSKLWKCKQNHKSQENWKPSINTASLWEVINEQSAGTIDDPIPYDINMTVYKDKYYLENGMKYKCIRDSGQPLYASCESLLGNYFEKV